MKSNIYQNIKQSSTNKLAFIDVDNTLTANPWGTEEKDLLDAKLTNQAIALLKKAGYCCILNTSRTEEMCMSSKQYMLSKQHYHFKRPAPQIGMGNDGRRFYIKLEDFYPINLLDLPIIISSSGAKISVLQNEEGYREDMDFYPPCFLSPKDWRKETMLWLSKIKSAFSFSYSPIESEDFFVSQKTDIFPPDYRIQLSFPSVHELIQFSMEMKRQKPLFFLTNDSNPDKHSFILYITPKRGKFEAIEHVISQLIESLLFKKEQDIEILFIGDSFPDFEAGIHNYTHFEAKKTVLLVGGSRLFSYLNDKNQNNFAGIDLTYIKKQYTDTITKNIQTVILGDLAFPKAIGPRSIIEFLS